MSVKKLVIVGMLALMQSACSSFKLATDDQIVKHFQSSRNDFEKFADVLEKTKRTTALTIDVDDPNTEKNYPAYKLRMRILGIGEVKVDNEVRFLVCRDGIRTKYLIRRPGYFTGCTNTASDKDPSKSNYCKINSNWAIEYQPNSPAAQ